VPFHGDKGFSRTSLHFFKLKVFVFGLNVSYNGKVRFGRRVDIRVTDGGAVVIGDGTYLSNDVQIAEYVTIRDQDHRILNNGKPLRGNGFEVGPVTIGDNVWLGAKATVTKGVVIKMNAVVGANSVVTNDVDENESPARAIKSY